MKQRLLAMSLVMGALVLGFTGCASTPETNTASQPAADQASAQQAIADAKAAAAEAKALDAEWTTTGDLIKQAEEALAAGDYAKATELANEAKRQAENAVSQAKAAKDKAAMASESAAASTGAGMTAAGSYQVVRGDNLWNIAGKSDIYGDPYQWPLIYKTNQDKIKDADLIYPGQNFEIDHNASAADVDAAIKHAKTRGAWSLGATEDSDKAYLGK